MTYETIYEDTVRTEAIDELLGEYLVRFERLRVVVRHDRFYPAQSTATCERWTRAGTWVEIGRLLPATVASPAQARTRLLERAAELLALA